MLYDEEGRTYVEHPIIPDEQHLMYIVKDYRRMYGEYWKLKVHNKKLGATNMKLANHNYSLTHKNQEQRNVIRHCLKWMKKNGIEPSTFLKTYSQENKL